MFSGHYDSWIISRMNGINKYMLPGTIKGKTLLEVGCGYAHIGNKFHELGAIITSSDARNEHIAYVNNIYPHIATMLIDGDNLKLNAKYDIILHWGVLYHLNEIENHLKYISNHCDILLLETEVADSDDDTFYITTSEKGYDQAYNSVGIRPSPSYVEKILSANGFSFKLIKDSILNTNFHVYDWDIKNTKTWRSGMRRFWICWKNIESPVSQ